MEEKKEESAVELQGELEIPHKVSRNETPLERVRRMMADAMKELGEPIEGTPTKVAVAQGILLSAVNGITQAEIDAEMMGTMVEHIYHHNDPNDAPKVSVKAEKNTKGYNFESGVSNCTSPEQAIEILKKTTDSLQRTYGQPAGSAPSE